MAPNPLFQDLNILINLLFIYIYILELTLLFIVLHKL